MVKIITRTRKLVIKTHKITTTATLAAEEAEEEAADAVDAEAVVKARAIKGAYRMATLVLSQDMLATLGASVERIDTQKNPKAAAPAITLAEEAEVPIGTPTTGRVLQAILQLAKDKQSLSVSSQSSKTQSPSSLLKMSWKSSTINQRRSEGSRASLSSFAPIVRLQN